jgi:hypothetical protein
MAVRRHYQSEIIDDFDALVARGVIDKLADAAPRDSVSILLIDHWNEVKHARQRGAVHARYRSSPRGTLVSRQSKNG